MKRANIFVLIVGLVGVLALAAPALASHKSSHSPSGGSAQKYTLDFIATANALSPETSGKMTIKVVNGETVVHFRLRNGYPNMVYTIWIVYNRLRWPLCYKVEKGACTNFIGPGPVLSSSPANGFPKEGLGVAPLAGWGPFSDGMGLDPGLVFVTDENGNGEAQVRVPYNLVGDKEDGPPVGNKNLLTQCVPGPPNSDGSCPNINGNKKIFIAGTWLRKFIIDVEPEDRGLSCANYDPASDQTNVAYDPVVPGVDAQYWQCIDPATLRDPNDPWSGLPRVPRFRFDHFRLAPHPDALTHGFFGGNFFDHFVDAVGLRCDRTNGVPGKGLTPPPSDC